MAGTLAAFLDREVILGTEASYKKNPDPGILEPHSAPGPPVFQASYSLHCLELDNCHQTYSLLYTDEIHHFCKIFLPWKLNFITKFFFLLIVAKKTKWQKHFWPWDL